MANERALIAQLGKQTAFDTPATPTIKLPWTVDYEDAREVLEREWDAGQWVPSVIAALLSEDGTFKTSGVIDFEMLPVVFDAGIADVTPTGTDPYTAAYEMDPAGPGTPAPMTLLIGAAGENIGATGAAVRLPNSYLTKLTLAGGINEKAIKHEGEWIATTVDDNSGAGYALISGLTPPAAIVEMNALLGEWKIQDAAATGGDFATMTAFDCAILNWRLTMDFGIKPKRSVDGNRLTYAGIRRDNPAVELEATIRLNQANYALVRGKHLARTFQELQFVINGAASRKATFELTGWWADAKSGHMREDGEVVMKAKFNARTPHFQTTTPHFFGATVVSKHNW